MEDKEIARFYDGFVAEQERLSFNERHFLLVEKLEELGLSRTSNVLEFGCGIGVITALIATIVTEGRIVASDISPKSVALARKRLEQRGDITFVAADLVDFSCRDVDFDFVTLFDVLEHIPANAHERVFARLADHMTQNTRLFVNIPSPEHLEYLIKTDPGSLQIVDQPLPADHILKHAYAAGLTLQYFETYGIWCRGDYQMMLFAKKQPFANVRVDRRPGIGRRLRRSLKLRRVDRLARSG